MKLYPGLILVLIICCRFTSGGLAYEADIDFVYSGGAYMMDKTGYEDTVIGRFVEMKVKYFSDTDTAHLVFTDRDVHEAEEISENIHIDIDEKGNLVSVTIEHAKAGADLWEFSYQEIHRKTAEQRP